MRKFVIRRCPECNSAVECILLKHDSMIFKILRLLPREEPDLYREKYPMTIRIINIKLNDNGHDMYISMNLGKMHRKGLVDRKKICINGDQYMHKRQRIFAYWLTPLGVKILDEMDGDAR